MMNAVNPAARHVYGFEDKVWPAAAKKGVALAAMKVFGGAPGGAKKPKGARMPEALQQAALRYALGLPQVSVVVLGIYDEQELAQDLAWVRAYKPLDKEERKALAVVVGVDTVDFRRRVA